MKSSNGITSKMNIGPLHFLLCGFLLIAFTCATAKDNTWIPIDNGLSYAKFKVPIEGYSLDSQITVVRIDPKKYALRLCTVSELGGENRTAREWVEGEKLIGAINAGMYLTDYTTNCGYMKNYTHLNNPRNNKTYHSVAAFNPIITASTPFRIFDNDVVNNDSIIKLYQTVIQNLRLIKRPSVNRWQPQEKRWTEAALGEDRTGNILFIFSRVPFSMHEFNTLLLSLPIGIVCAQHLEGGPEASLYLNHNGIELSRTGNYGGDYGTENSDSLFRPLPNVLGVVRR